MHRLPISWMHVAATHATYEEREQARMSPDVGTCILDQSNVSPLIKQCTTPSWIHVAATHATYEEREQARMSPGVGTCILDQSNVPPLTSNVPPPLGRT